MLLFGTIVGGIALLCTVGLLYYYVPVWFFRLVRKDANGSIEEKCPYSKALGTSLIIAVPIVIEGIVDALSKLNVGSSSLLFISLSILAIIFIFWWMYAINAMLPYLVHDHHEMSVEQAVKKSICMMDGHKWELFKVDFKIIFLPSHSIKKTFFCPPGCKTSITLNLGSISIYFSILAKIFLYYSNKMDIFLQFIQFFLSFFR